MPAPVELVPVADAVPRRPRMAAAGTESMSSYFREVSYGRHALSGQVFGPFAFKAEDAELCSLAGAQKMVAELLPRIPGMFDQYLWYFGSPLRGCGWEGIAELGSAARPTRNSYYSGSDGCTVLIQEPGHNYGMVHSSALRCQQDGKRVTLPGPGQGQCEHVEYGHPYDPMGDGCGHMNGVQKAYLGWLGGCNVVTTTGAGLYSLRPLERSCDGPQLLHVPLQEPRFRFGNTPGLMTGYYLEYRTATGLDLGVPDVPQGSARQALAARTDDGQLAGLAMILAGLATSATSSADTRHNELLPQRIYIAAANIDRPDSSVRLDVRRIETLKDGQEMVGNRTRIKVVKNKVAPPFKQAEFDIMYGQGISREGGLIDVGVEAGLVRKAGAWYTYEGDQLGQGKENARSFLRDNPDLADELEKKILEKLGVGPTVDAEADPVPAEPTNVDF